MKVRLLMILALSFLVVTAFACGQKEEPAEEPESSVVIEEETEGVYSRLARHVQADDSVIHDSVDQAWTYLQAVMAQGGMDAYLDTLQAHCLALREAYPVATLRGLLDDLVGVAESDGEIVGMLDFSTHPSHSGPTPVSWACPCTGSGAASESAP